MPTLKLVMNWLLEAVAGNNEGRELAAEVSAALGYGGRMTQLAVYRGAACDVPGAVATLLA